MSLGLGPLLAGLCGMAAIHAAETVREASPPGDDGAIPQPLKLEHLDALLANPPFTRSLGVSDSLILTGVVRFENDVFATLLDTKTLESHVVTTTANHHGWQLAGISGDPAEIEKCAARIQLPGGEVVSIRYQLPPKKTMLTRSGGSSSGSGSSGGAGGNAPPLSQAQIDEARNAAVNYKEGFNADGYPQAPPREMVDKLSRLSVSQREDINRQMFGYRNQGLGLDERRKIYEGLVERSMQGRR